MIYIIIITIIQQFVIRNKLNNNDISFVMCHMTNIVQHICQNNIYRTIVY